MKVGVFFRGGNPPPWQRDWHEYYQDTLEQVELAEEVGFDAVTTTEHHFSPDGYFPSPLIFEAASAFTSESKKGALSPSPAHTSHCSAQPFT